MIKVLFMIHDLSMGGAEKVLVNLVNNMNHNKFDITILALFGGGVNESFLCKDIKYKTVFRKCFRGNSKIMKLFSPRMLHKCFIKDKYDIEISYLEGPSARIISGCSNRKTKLVSWIHVEQHSKKIAAQSFRNYKEAQNCYKKFDKTICVSEEVKKDFQKLFPVLPEAEVLYNTNETDMIRKQMQEAVPDDLFKDEEFKIIGVGKIVPVKGFYKLARIHKQLRDKGFPVHCYILGDGDERGRIEDFLRSNKLEETFTFLGYQTNPYKYVSKCDLFVCTSNAEGFSTAATEALIVGVPIVTTDVSGMREMLGANNEYGIITENDEDHIYKEIERLILDGDKLIYYKKMAIHRGTFFDKETTVNAVEKMIHNLQGRDSI